MSTERDELAEVVWDLALRHLGIATSSSKPIADELLAAGYRKPRQVTTVEELDALPTHSVISEAIGYAWQKAESGHWVSWLNPGESSTWMTTGRRGPFTVLREGGSL